MKTWYNLSCHSHVENAFLFLSNSRLSARVPRDCDKHEKQQVGGSLIRGTMGSKWQNENPEKKKESDRKYREKNADKVKESQRKWRLAHPDKKYQNDKKWRQANKEIERERSRIWHALNQIKAIASTRNWRRAHPSAVSNHNRNRRARIMGSEGKVTTAELEELKRKQNYTCLCCGRQEPEIELTHDHVKPLVVGGENTIENSQMLCHSCNSRKGSKWIDYRKAAM